MKLMLIIALCSHIATVPCRLFPTNHVLCFPVNAQGTPAAPGSKKRKTDSPPTADDLASAAEHEQSVSALMIQLYAVLTEEAQNH